MEKKKKIIIFSLVGIILFIILGGIFYFNSINKKVSKWEDKIYPNVQVYGVDIGGLNKEEAVNKLNENLHELIMNKKLLVTSGDNTIELNYSELDPKYNIDEIVNNALNYGKDKSLFQKNSLIEGKKIIALDAEITYDEKQLLAIEEKVKESFDIAPKNAEITISSGKINIKDEVIGKSIDENELHKKLLENINGNIDEEKTIEIALKDTEPKIKTEDLKKITGKISDYSSSYANTGDGRVKNMQIAAETVSGTIVMPGEEFSYNELIGDTTPDKGYEKANTYVGDEIVPDYGGGICQVSTTLYRAVMRANIRSTERMNHSMIVSYSEPGLDATVANGYIDYKFVNTYDFPIYIQGYVSGGVVNFSIYGNVEAMGNKTYDLISVVNEKIAPEVVYKEDNTLEEGKEVVKSYGMTGYKATAYQVTYENGVEVNRELISNDTYLKTDTIIRKGTKKKETNKEESNKQEDNKADSNKHEDSKPDSNKQENDDKKDESDKKEDNQ